MGPFALMTRGAAKGRWSTAPPLALLLILSLLLPLGSAVDTDGDGFDDSVDLCPLAVGTSTVDRTGCPDRDGDGTSDWTDRWTISGVPFQRRSTNSVNYNYNSVDHSPDGELVVTGDENGWVQIWNTSTFTLGRSTQLSNDIVQVGWSDDGSMVAATIDLSGGDELWIWWAENLTVRHQNIDVDVGNGDTPGNLAFSPDGSMIAVTVGRSGNGGTNGEVKLINTTSGVEEMSFNPNGEDRFDSVAWSPDGSRIAFGGNDDMWIYTTNLVNSSTPWQIEKSLTGIASSTINDLAWSPDGNYISICEAWGGSNSKASVVYATGGASFIGTKVWSEKTHTSSCYSTDFSPDSRLVVYSISYYQQDGGSSRIYATDTGNAVDTLDSCPSGNNCGQVNGISWSSTGTAIVSVNGRDDEGIYFWNIDLDPDLDGWNTTDQGDGRVDHFPIIPTQWNDTDLDGYGDNSFGFEPDACPTIWGESIQDRYGCPDSDGDQYSDADANWTINDGADALPNDPLQWMDSDGDGFGDNRKCTWDVALLMCTTQAGDAFIMNPTQWNDTDDDGWGDNFGNASWSAYRPVDWPGEYRSNATQSDALPRVRDQWNDSDGDLYGDNPDLPSNPRVRADACPYVWGDSWRLGRYGCPDVDRDGYGDQDDYNENPPDQIPDDSTQYRDLDEDGYGDNVTGNNSDHCPGQWGNSSRDRRGCIDSDGDGWSDPCIKCDQTWTINDGADAVVNNPTQWEDSDGDGYGDNVSGTEYDAFPNDETQWKDSDNDGYGDNYTRVVDFESGVTYERGDAFIDEPTQWTDFDGDRFGDNYDSAALAALGIVRYCSGMTCPGQNVPGAVNTDICPILGGYQVDAGNRGCADSDGDLVPDNLDPWPLDKDLSIDLDGDGYAEDDNAPRQYKDACPNTSQSLVLNDLISHKDRLGCDDSDGDGWSDPDTGHTIASPASGSNGRPDALPHDATQWVDCDGDGWGDNWGDPLMNETRMEQQDIFGDRCDGAAISELEDQPLGQWIEGATNVDVFPKEPTQWSDSDGDGFGDNYGAVEWTQYWDENEWPGQLIENPFQPDRFPLDPTQWKDLDVDGYGDNSLISADYPDYDMCPQEWGNATERLYRGCPDLDGDGYADENDGCPTDPNIHDTICPVVTESANQELKSGGFAGGMSLPLLVVVAVIVLLVVLFAFGIGRSGSRSEEEMMVANAPDQVDDDERKSLWIEHYLRAGQIAEAKALGWQDPADRPVWQQFEEQQKAEIVSALPSMIDLEDP